MDAVRYFETIQVLDLVLMPVLVIVALAARWPRTFSLRCFVAIMIGWFYTALFTIYIYNPAGIEAGHAVGMDFPENHYDNNTTGLTMVFGWLGPAIYTGAAALLRVVWLRVRRVK